MKIKYSVGKDRTKDIKKRRRQSTGGALVCRNCQDTLNSEGFCVRCAAILAHYRDVDSAKAAASQQSRGGAVWAGRH